MAIVSMLNDMLEQSDGEVEKSSDKLEVGDIVQGLWYSKRQPAIIVSLYQVPLPRQKSIRSKKVGILLGSLIPLDSQTISYSVCQLVSMLVIKFVSQFVYYLVTLNQKASICFYTISFFFFVLYDFPRKLLSTSSGLVWLILWGRRWPPLLLQKGASQCCQGTPLRTLSGERGCLPCTWLSRW